MKVFIGLIEIAGYYSGLRRNLSAAGMPADFLCALENPFRYDQEPFPRNPWLVRGILNARARSRGTRHRLVRTGWKVVARFLLMLLFPLLVPHYDVFIFGFGTHFLPLHLDYLLLRVLGKRVICVFNGSDHRPPFLNGTQVGADGEVDVKRCVAQARGMKRRISRIERWAHLVVGHHLSAQFHERPFVPGLLPGVPFAMHEPRDVPPPRSDGRIRILHAPSMPLVKGSERIRETIQKLQQEGLPIEFIEIRNKPHAEVLEQLAECDFVIDELFSDSRMAAFAAEAGYFGKPAVVCGYATDEYLSIPDAYPPEEFAPVCFGRPEQLEPLVRKMIADPQYRLDLGRRASEYVRNRVSPERVAERFARLIRGDFPPSWLYDAQKIRYFHGFGLTEERLRMVFRAIIERHGIGALQFSDKPVLEGLVRSFAETGPREG